MSSKFVLQPLVVGRFPSFPLSKFLHQDDSGSSVEAPCIAWLARSLEDGKLILVDTGPSIPTAETSKFHVGLDVKIDDRIDKVLASQGIDPSDITDVIFTHLHFDHCSYAEFLPNAKIYVQKKELVYAVAPNSEHRTGYETGYRSVIPAWMKSFDKFQVIEGDYEIGPGARILSLPGHTPGSSGAVFDTKAGRYAVVGDLVNQIENWEGNNHRHIAPSLHSSLEDCFSSFAKLEKESEVVLASHDIRMLDRSQYGS